MKQKLGSLVLVVIFGSVLWNGAPMQAGEDNRHVSDERAAYEYQIEGQEHENFRYLVAQCWLPKAKQVRGILCLVIHPDGANGRVIANVMPWVGVATKNDFALITVSIVESEDPTMHWFSAELGSGKALLEVINYFAQASNHPELSLAPLAMAGVCAAGQFAYEFSSFVPSRMLCFVSIGGGKHDLSLVRHASSVPGLFIVTSDLGLDATQNLRALALLGTLEGAQWKSLDGVMAMYDKGFCQRNVLKFLGSHLSPISEGNKVWPPPNESSSLFYGERIVYGDASYQAFSFKGSVLPKIASVEPDTTSPVTFGEDCLLHTSFCILAEGEKVDEISVPFNIKHESLVQRINETKWKVSLTIDSAGIPSGGFRMEVPLRFSSRGRSLLGGLQVALRGSIERDIYSVPSAIRLSRGIGTVRLQSRSSSLISLVEIENVTSRDISVRYENRSDGAQLIIVERKVFGDHGVEKPIAGFFVVRATSKKTERVKIPFY